MARSQTLSAGLAVLALVLAAGFSFLFLSADPITRAEAEPTQLTGAQDLRGRSSEIASRVRVIDGDTIEDLRAGATYRLVNIDTPETGSRARCSAERALGDRATEAARTLIAHARQLELRATGRIDRYGRIIAVVLIDGQDMGETLMAEGLARPWRGRREPWCDANGNLIP